MSILKNSVYSVIDLVTLYKGVPRTINNFTMRFPAKWSRYFAGEYEKENAVFLSRHCQSGMTVIDVGAHLGLFSLIAAQLVGEKGKVYAFEPTPGTFETLKKIIKLNNAQSIIQPVHQAVSNKKGYVNFFVDEYDGSNANSLVARDDKKRASVQVGLTTIDDFVYESKLEKVDFMKIDAEGVELDVIRGATATIKKFRPKIILALHPPLIKNNVQTLEEIYDTLIQLNYDIYLDNKKINSSSFCEIQDLFDVHLIPIN